MKFFMGTSTPRTFLAIRMLLVSLLSDFMKSRAMVDFRFLFSFYSGTWGQNLFSPSFMLSLGISILFTII